MNRHFFSLGTAALFLGAMGFTACSSDDLGNEGSGPLTEGNVVKTQFAINIPYGAGNAAPQTASALGSRMTEDKTQSQTSPSFLGMQGIRLIPMTATGADNVAISSIITLGNITTDTGGEGLTNGHKIYADVPVPVGTTHFLFYGAGGTTAAATPQNKFDNGSILPTIAGATTAGISFTLEKALGQDTDGEQTQLLAVLNGVAGAKATVSGEEKTWANQADNELAELYTNFTGLEAGSANSICKTLERLYNAVDNIKTSGSDEEKAIADAIQKAIVGTYSSKTPFSFTGTGDPAAAPYTLTTDLTYPQNMNMPDGAATVTFSKDANPQFTAGQTGVVSSNPTIAMSSICYPASIYYTVNTPAKTTTDETVTWPNSVTAWESAFTDWGSSVTAATRTIALDDPIQYGVAKLESTVKLNAASLEDKNGTMVSVPNGFTVTGILVGGQPVKADWDLKPSASDAMSYTIYDKSVVSGMKATTSASSKNYTLVLDNYQATAQTVYVAIELKNDTNTDFQGVDGIVPAGGTFYLIGTLKPSEGKGTITGVDDPYVFMQDYTTTANFTISSLKNAYNVIPDLRASQLQLGLAVDLTWKTGLSFDVSIE